MISKSKAVVLHQVKFSETSVIVTLYTESFGRRSYIINGIRSIKNKQNSGLFQPLFLLEIDAIHKSNRDVQRLKEYKLAYAYKTIPFDIAKSTISIFISELMFKIFVHEEYDPEMFQFIYNSLLYFDSMTEGSANFHLWFIINLLSYLGVQPENNYDSLNKWFDIKNSRFVPIRPVTSYTPDLEESKHLSMLIDMNIEQLVSFTISGNQRFRLLMVISEYYTYHFEGLGEIKSLKVLKEVFH